MLEDGLGGEWPAKDDGGHGEDTDEVLAGILVASWELEALQFASATHPLCVDTPRDGVRLHRDRVARERVRLRHVAGDGAKESAGS